MDDGNTLLVGDHLPSHHTTSLFDDDSSADVTVIGEDEGKQIRAHALLLSSASPVFKRMFEGDWKENEKGVVKLDQFDWSVVRALISLVYSRPVEIREDKLAELYKAGHMYDVPVVMKSVARCVSGVRNKECVVELASCASTLGGDCEDEVHDVFGSYLIKCLNDVADVGRVPHKTMLVVVKAEETDLSELEVLCGVLEWSRAHKDLALEDQQELFSHIRYGQVPIKDMLEVISKGGFPCGAEFTKIMMFYRDIDPADVLANLALFRPRERATDPSFLKDVFPLALHKSSSDLSIHRIDDPEGAGMVEFKMASILWLMCYSPVVFAISLCENNPEVVNYLNMKFWSSNSKLYVGVKTLERRSGQCHKFQKLIVRISGIGNNGQTTRFIVRIDSNYNTYCTVNHPLHFEATFPWIIQIAVKNTSFTDMSIGNEWVKHYQNIVGVS